MGWAQRKQVPCSSQRGQTDVAPWLLGLKSLHHTKGLHQEDEHAHPQGTPPALLYLNAEVQPGALLPTAGKFSVPTQQTCSEP